MLFDNNLGREGSQEVEFPAQVSPAKMEMQKEVVVIAVESTKKDELPEEPRKTKPTTWSGVDGRGITFLFPYSKEFQTEIIGNGGDTFSVFHQNVQYLNNSVEELQAFLADIPCDVVCITEHWMSEDQIKFAILENCNLVSHFCRDLHKHGGSAIYVSKKHNAEKLEEINKLSRLNVFECCGAEIFVNKRKVVVLCVYRPPSSDVSEFILHFENALTVSLQLSSFVFIAGDFNVNILEQSASERYFTDVLDSCSFKITITEPSRVTETSATCLDNILVPSHIFDDINCKKVMPTGYSDHFAQLVTSHTSEEIAASCTLKWKSFI
ncbi:hypothetical protein QE152_g36505 [Popillia japonica]|uniref:Endonuclease/exonuclease/phosphatase domain-containing protein n=1 Tax=Popillia japonica TaxID=7064 RepID=A0AAW1ICJ5_POPJA